MDPIVRPRRAYWLAGRVTPRQVDLAVVIAAFVTSFPEVRHGGVRPVSFAVWPVAAAALWWRRRHPAAVLGVVAGAFAVGVIFGRAGPGGAFVFAMYAASLYGSRRLRRIALWVAAGALVVAFSVVLATGEAKQLGHLAGPAFGAGVAWALGDRNRNRNAYLSQLEERARSAERDREENARRAREDERNRIARELHDVVAHNVSVIAVQAGAARTTAAGDAERAVEALGLVERTARATLSELRALLGVLRKDDAAPLQPQPTLAQLDDLVRRASDAGLRVQTHIEGAARALPGVVELAAYRVVQEALTNAIKHAPGSSVAVRLEYGRDSLSIDVVDDGPGPNGAGSGGHGLIGMRERVALLGGAIRTGAADARGFRVHVTLPAAQP